MRYLQYLSGFNIILGLWLVISPFVLGFSEIQSAFLSSVITGCVVFVVSIVEEYLSYKGAEMKTKTI